jgi:GT2 family glycosyltransferase
VKEVSLGGDGSVDLSIVIVNWNTRELLGCCLASIQAKTQGIFYETFVVDNASTDGSTAMVREKFPDVVLMQNEENRGFARANNQAIRRSKGRYILLLNPDTIVLDNALGQMVAFADAEPHIGALGCKILTTEGNIDFRCARRFPSLLTELFSRTRLSKRHLHHPLFGRFLMGDWDHNSDREVECLAGSCMMVRREVIEQVGLLDEDFFMYGEDMEWCYRIRKAGWQIFYHSEPQIVHVGGQSTEQNRAGMGIEYLRSMTLFFRKCYGTGHALAYQIFLLITTLAKRFAFSIGLLLSNNSKRKNWYREKVQIQRRVLQWIFSDLRRR